MIGIRKQTEKYYSQADQLDKFTTQCRGYRTKRLMKIYANAFTAFNKSVSETVKAFKDLSGSINQLRNLTNK